MSARGYALYSVCPNFPFFSSLNFIFLSSGPGNYNIVGMGSESMKKAYVESTRRGVFGTTSERIKPLNTRSVNELPGPAHYQVTSSCGDSRYGL